MNMREFPKNLDIPLEEIESATNNFSDENLIKRGSYFHVHKGQLLLPSPAAGQLVNIVARISKKRRVAINELAYLNYLSHKNIVSLIHVSYTEDRHLIMITKHEANESLDRHLSSSSLTWMRRLRICLGVAHALTYLHYDAYDDRYIIHGNIMSSKILLDHDWEPKLNGFGFAASARKNTLHFTKRYGYAYSSPYMDPAYGTTICLTQKSDIFSFGVVLFEVLFGTEAYIQDNDVWYFARLARSHYEEGKLDDLIDPDLRNQMNLQSLNMFAETAYWCIKEQRSQRPDTNQVCHRLARAMELQHKHENPMSAIGVEGISSNYLKGESLDHLRLKLSDIVSATNTFSKDFCLGSGGYGMVYKAKLNHWDGKDELPMKHSTVAIKRLFPRDDEGGEKGFVAEIETLSNCKHPNVVSLLGFCDEGSELILVYEYVTKGSLAGYLGNINNMINLTWAQRLQICLDIAHGLAYLHAFNDDKPMIVHRDIKSENILLGDNWVAKIADFGLSKLHANQHLNTLVTKNIAGTEMYLDPEYVNTGKLKKESDIYSFGVVMCEILHGRLVYDQIDDTKGLVSKARQCLNDETLEELVDPKLKEADETISMLNGGVNQDSLGTFLKIAIQCLSETQSGRPTLEVIINELEKALNFQRNNKDRRHVSLEAIEAGTQNFSDCKCISEGKYWKLYEGEVAHNNTTTPVLVKRWDSMYRQGYTLFYRELDTVVKSKHKNIIRFIGYCNEKNEKIIVYEHVSNGRLDKHLSNPSITWIKRLNICVDIGEGLKFMHEGRNGKRKVIHRDIRSGNILLDDNWVPKISNLELCIGTDAIEAAYHLDDNSYGSSGYADPEYSMYGYLTLTSDIYSLGVILLEMLCGRLAWGEGCEDHSQSLGALAVRHCKEKGNLDEMIFEGIKQQIAPRSLAAFERVALQCLDKRSENKTDMGDVVMQLKKSLTFQEDYDIWEPKLPVDFKEIIKISKNPDTYNSIEMRKDLYHMFCKGILLQDSKVWLSIGSSGERNEMISAKRFSYGNLREWRSLPESRFPKVAELFNISDLKIQIKIRTQFLSPQLNYKVHLIFRFHGPRKPQAKGMYVNLKYKMGNESLNAYFATWRDDGWMMIELFRFFSHRKDTNFEVVLESLSRCYCGSDSIYIEGILFQAFDDASLKKDHTNRVSLSQMKGQEVEMLTAEEVVYNSTNIAIQSRFSGAIELLRHQIFHIKCKIKSQMLAPNTENACYLVFKISDKFCGLHGPVIARDEFHWRRKETRIIYFRNPNPWNLHDTDSVPVERQDGWMEVIVWKFNSNYELKDDHLFVNLKLVTYEGTMSGLIVRGIEFRLIKTYPTIPVSY